MTQDAWLILIATSLFFICTTTIACCAIYYDYKIERIPQGNIDLRFNTIMNELKIPSLGKHDAYNDAIMTSMIFLKLKNLPKVKIN